MRVKFYKGPMHGKTKDIDPSMIDSLGLVYVNIMRNRLSALVQPNPPSSGIPLNFTVAEYEVRMMSGEINGKKFFGPAVHPDGSLFLQFVKEKK